MSQKYLNNFDTQFIAAVKNAPTSGTPATELDYGILRVTLSAASSLGTLSGGDYYILTAYKKSGTVESNVEVFKVTAIDTSVVNETRLTVSRAQEGTTAQAYVPGDYVSLRFTKGGADGFAQRANNLSDLVSAATARTNLGLGSAAVENTTAFAPATHTTDTANPHAVTKTQVGLGNVEDKSSATIRSEITSLNVTTALGFTPYNATNPSGYISGITSLMVTTALGFTPENATNRGAANGYAPLGSDSKVPAGYLPSYVDDVLEYVNFAALPGTGSAGVIYVTLDNNKIYRWSGSAYVEISPSPGSTDSVTEGSVNLYFTNARAQAALSGMYLPIGGGTLTGDLTFGSSHKILGDFNNATASLRTLFQSSAAGNTSVGAVPNTSGSSAWRSYGGTDPSNAAYAELLANPTSSEIRLSAGKVGTGSYWDLTLWAGGAEAIRVSNAGGHVAIGTASTNLLGSSSARSLTLSAGTTAEAIANFELQGARSAQNSAFGGISFYHKTNRTAAINATRGSADDESDLRFYTQKTGGSLTERIRVGVDGITAFFGTAYSPEITLTDSATVNWDTSLGNVAKVTLGGNRTIAAPTNLATGSFYSLNVIQDGTGSRTATWNSVFAFTGGTAPTLSTAASAVDEISFRYDGTKLREVGRSMGAA